jgi:hypothetical protein
MGLSMQIHGPKVLLHGSHSEVFSITVLVRDAPPLNAIIALRHVSPRRNLRWAPGRAVS